MFENIGFNFKEVFKYRKSDDEGINYNIFQSASKPVKRVGEAQLGDGMAAFVH